MAYYTDEDRCILANLRSYGAYREAGIRDAAIMAEFADQDGQRATLAPITLATIGLDSDEVHAIAREHWDAWYDRGERVTMQGSEHASEPASLEHITLDSRIDWVQNPPNGIEEC